MKKPTDIEALKPELRIADTHSNISGLVHQYEWYTAQGEETLESRKFPFEVYLVLEKGGSFFEY